MSNLPPSRQKKAGLFTWANISGAPNGPDAHKASGDKSAQRRSGEIASSVKNIRERIVGIWKVIWTALYKSHERASFHRIDELRGLCLGAGASLMTVPTSKLLGPLDSALCHGSSHATSLEYLKLEENTPLELLEALLQILEAYSGEIDPVNRIFSLLRSAQVGLREPTTSDWVAVKDEIGPVAETTGRKLMHFHARLYMLQLDIETDALSKRPDGRPRWLLVKDMAYPPAKKMSSVSK